MNNLWRNEGNNSVSAKDKLQDLNLKQLKLKVNDIYKKDKKRTTNFELHNNDDVVNKTYLLDTKILKVEVNISIIEKDYNEFKLRNNKQSEEVLKEKAVKTTIQIFYEQGFFDIYDNAGEILKD